MYYEVTLSSNGPPVPLIEANDGREVADIVRDYTNLEFNSEEDNK